MSEKIRVAILEDHQSTIDGYNLRLAEQPNISLVATAFFSEEIIPMLKANPADVLILDVNVPISKDNRNIQPIHKLITELKKDFPDLVILVISMHAQRAMIRSILEAGTKGYILKDDYASVRNLGSIIETLAKGGTYMSNRVSEIIFSRHLEDSTLTPRELEVLSICAAYPDENTGDLANRLEIANSTVRNFLHRIYIKLQVHGRAAAILKAQEKGLIPSSEPGKRF
jgi:DNA-binding NarL/FixJ family response regulator